MEKKFDKDKLAIIVRRMKGARSVREFAKDADLSESFLSKCINGNIDSPPSKRTMLKLSKAKSEEEVDVNDLMEAAGYSALEIQGDDFLSKRSLSASIFEEFGGDLLGACYELQKTLIENGIMSNRIDGIVSSMINLEKGFFEVKDETASQVYVGIMAFCKKGSREIDVVLAASELYYKLIKEDDADNKIFCIMTDNESIYTAYKETIRLNSTPKTVILYTSNHRDFEEEWVVDCAESDV